jgi:hypothetical protein
MLFIRRIEKIYLSVVVCNSSVLDRLLLVCTRLLLVCIRLLLVSTRL